MRTIELSDASHPLAEYASELKGQIMLLTVGSRPVAAIVPLKGLDRESLALSAHPEFLDLIARSRAEFAAGQKLSLDEMKRAVLPRQKAIQQLKQTARKYRRPRTGG
jgi:antitoxin (DNA-binding transcriptional repressor) of toxin-antitoxin stability system